MTALHLKNITKEYDNGYRAVRGITMDIYAGEFLVLVGPSGCGKSSLLRMIAGLETITGGDLYFGDERMNDTEPRHRDIGMVFQNYALYPHLSVARNIAFPLDVRKEPKDAVVARVNEVAAMLGIDSLLDRLPKQLSGGQRQRVALGRAIARTPRVFLFDEPLSNLDANLRVEMRTELTALQRKVGSTAVYVTHDHTEAMTMGDRIAVMNNGELLQVGTPADLYANPQSLFVAEFLGSPKINSIAGSITTASGVTVFATDEGTFTLPLGTTPLPAGTATLCIRPEHLALGNGNIEIPPATVVHTEYLGHESLLHCRSGSVMLRVRTSTDSGISRGDTIPLHVQRSHLLLFRPA
ncbi:MAG: sn-glycerol-3-phosphate ABC transporter ATP-binding protein UgpC, partial [Candidatus Kapabacteria bacterium]|nr:sn-glycerol-3-phosphate ABC transporter ATP-binding protein UgpC [Candidatus Kapabacteria bacterium]